MENKGKRKSNTLADLNDYLFEQLEDLNDPDISDGDLDKAIKRSEAITSVAGTIIQTAELSLKAIKIMADAGADVSASNLPQMLGVKE